MATSKDNSEQKKSENVIFSILDTVSTDLVKQMDTALKDKDLENRDVLEQNGLTGIEEVYRTQMKTLMEQVYEVLNQKEELWDPSDDELYSLLERIVFLKARENTFSSFFDSIEDVIAAASQLDFSKRVPLFEISKDKRNLFNYAVMCLNILVEKMETSVVSMKAVNTMLSSMPDTIMIVTDKNGVIRFVNDSGEKLLGLKKNEYLSKSIYLLLEEHEQISKEYAADKQLTNRPVNLIIPGQDKKITPALLTIPKSYNDHTEIEEIVYSISIDDKPQNVAEKEFNLTQELHDKVAPLNTIIGAATVLSYQINDDDHDGIKLVQVIVNSAEKIKADTTDSLNAINTGSNNFADFVLVDISKKVHQILDSLRLNEGFNEMQFDIDIAYDNNFYANPKLLHSIFQNLISNAIKYRGKTAPFVGISVRNSSKDELLVKITDNGIGIKEADRLRLFDKSFQVSEKNEGHGIGLYLIKESVERLNGSIEVQSVLGQGTTFSISIPYASK